MPPKGLYYDHEEKALRVSDADTGEPDQSELEKLQNEADRAVLEEAQAYERMCATEGFKLLEKYIYDQIDECKEKLIDAEDDVQIKRWQQTARAYSNLIGYVHERILAGKYLLEQNRDPSIDG